MKPRTGVTSEGHTEYKPVFPDPEDPVLNELEMMRGEDDRFDIIIDAIMNLSAVTLLQI